MRNPSYTKHIVLAIILVFGILVYLQYRYYTKPGPVSEPIVDGEMREMDGVRHTIDLDRVVEGGPGKDVIPSIDEPESESVASANIYLDDAGLGIALFVGGKQRFYPYQILVWHEVVNDDLNGQPMLVTYSPLTNTASVFDRTLEDKTLTFGVSGQLYNNNTLLFDRESDSRWLQASGQAVVGEKTGASLIRQPVVIMTWDAFKTAYPNGSVLSRQTGTTRDYTHDPYGDYATNNKMSFPLTRKDDRFRPKSIVYGFDGSSAQKAFFEDAILEKGLVNEQVGSAFLLVVHDSELDAVKAFDRIVNQQELTFQREKNILVDTQTSSRWNLEGKAISGDFRGSQLNAYPIEVSYWFSWFATYPNTEVLTL